MSLLLPGFSLNPIYIRLIFLWLRPFPLHMEVRAALQSRKHHKERM